MRQAIEEEFILDVLKHYIEYSTYYKIAKKLEEDKQFSKKKGIKKVAKYLKLHPTNIEQKIEIIVDHFRNNIKHLLNGNAKAMIVTDSRLMAVRYILALQKYIEEKKYTDIRPLVAFSGEVNDPEKKECKKLSVILQLVEVVVHSLVSQQFLMTADFA